MSRETILKLLNKKDREKFLENEALSNKLWNLIPESNKRPMYVSDLVDIFNNENIDLSIESICKRFNIILIKNNKLKKFKSKSKFNGENIIVEYKDKNEIYTQLGHIFQNFLRCIYFQYPPKYNLKTIDLHEANAIKFGEDLRKLIDKPKYTSSRSVAKIVDSRDNPELIESMKLTNEYLERMHKKYNIE